MLRAPSGEIVRGGSVLSIAGVRVGSAQRVGGGWLTGTTVLLPPEGSIAGVDVRGGGPATHETDVLSPGTHTASPHALVLTGGSAFGLAAASGAQSALAAAGIGFPAPHLAGAVVPIVPAAAVYDLGRGGGGPLPADAALGSAAAEAALTGADVPTVPAASAPHAAEPGAPPSAPSGPSGPGAPSRLSAVSGALAVRGSTGAGTGALMGRGLLRGGLGSACLRTAGGHLVAALVAANPMGDPLTASGALRAAGVLEGLGAEAPAAPRDWAHRALELNPAAADDPSLVLRADDASAAPRREAPGLNTTIAIVVTDARLDSAQTTRLAQSAHAGLARAVHPSHTLADGDTVFGLATGAATGAQPPGPEEVFALSAASADALALAIADAALSAAPHDRSAPATALGDWPEMPRPAALSELAPGLAEAWRSICWADEVLD